MRRFLPEGHAGEEFVARSAGANHMRQRMTDIGCVHAALAEPGFFKRKQTKELVDQFADDFDPALAPGPDLWRNQIEDRNPRRFRWRASRR